MFFLIFTRAYHLVLSNMNHGKTSSFAQINELIRILEINKLKNVTLKNLILFRA